MSNESKDRIVQKIQIPIEYAEVEVDASLDDKSNLITRLISDDEIRIQFNKNPEKMFRDVGIHIDERMIQKIQNTPITALTRDFMSQGQKGGGAIVLAVVVTLAFPTPLY